MANGRARRWLHGLQIAALAALVLPSCSDQPASTEAAPAPHGRIAIIGIDGADPTLVARWRAEGLLPTLDRLAREGASGKISTDSFILSPRIWTSVATGKSPATHGIEGWVHTAGPREGRVYRSSDRRGHALWNIFSDRGRTVSSVNWLITHPPERVNGVVVSDFAIPGRREGRMKRLRASEALADVAGATTWPLEWQQRVNRMAAAVGPLFEGAADKPERSGARFARPGSRARFADDLAMRVALAIDEEQQPGLLLLLLQGIDRISHLMWAGVAPSSDYPEGLQPSEKERRRFAAVLQDYYVYTDGLLAKVLERYGPDDLVIVLSDHGFEAQTNPAHPKVTGGHDSEAARKGVIFVRGRGIPAGAGIHMMGMNDVAPTVLAWAGLPVAEDMEGRPAGFLGKREFQTVPTYSGAIERVESPSIEAEAVLLEQLRELGYIQ